MTTNKGAKNTDQAPWSCHPPKSSASLSSHRQAVLQLTVVHVGDDTHVSDVVLLVHQLTDLLDGAADMRDR